jgi:hypothetical protein
MEGFTHKVEGGKQRCRRNTPGGNDIAGPDDKTAEQSAIVDVKAGYEKFHNVGGVLGSTHIARRRGGLALAASDLDIRHLG